MEFRDIIGKRITDIRLTFTFEEYGMNSSQCYIEIENEFFIHFPFFDPSDIRKCEPDLDAKSIFTNLDDNLHYHENPIVESIKEAHFKKRNTLINRVRRFINGYEPPIEEFEPYIVDYKENRVKNVAYQQIADLHWSDDDDCLEDASIELQNGYFIRQVSYTMHGTGAEGLCIYESKEKMYRPPTIRYTEHIIK